MKRKTSILTLISLLLLTTTLPSCRPLPKIKITAPAENEYIFNNYKFIVENIDPYDELKPETFHAWLDMGTNKEKDISNEFIYDTSTKKWASSYELEAGAHDLFTQAEFSYPDKPVTDQRNFIVFQETCMAGKVINTLGNPYNREINVSISQTGQLVATGEYDEDGNFCIDKVPTLVTLNASFPCASGKGLKINPLNLAYKSCEANNCNLIGEITLPKCSDN